MAMVIFQPLDVDHPIETTISRRFKVTHLDPIFGGPDSINMQNLESQGTPYF